MNIYELTSLQIIQMDILQIGLFTKCVLTNNSANIVFSLLSSCHNLCPVILLALNCNDTFMLDTCKRYPPPKCPILCWVDVKLHLLTYLQTLVFMLLAISVFSYFGLETLLLYLRLAMVFTMSKVFLFSC